MHVYNRTETVPSVCKLVLRDLLVMCLARYDYIHYANMYIVYEMLICFSVLDAFTMLVHNIRHAHVIQDMQFKRDVAYNNNNYIVIC